MSSSRDANRHRPPQSTEVAIAETERSNAGSSTATGAAEDSRDFDLINYEDIGVGDEDEVAPSASGGSAGTRATSNENTTEIEPASTSAVPSLNRFIDHYKLSFSSKIGYDRSTLRPDQEWQLGKEMETPLGFEIAIDNNGGMETRVLVGDLNFCNAESVQSANSYLWTVRQQVRECRERLRVSRELLHQQYTALSIPFSHEQHASLRDQMGAYAASNHNKIITWAELTKRFHDHFGGPPPSESTIRSYIAQNDGLKAMRTKR